MSNLEETFETEKLQIRKMFFRKLAVILICTIIAMIGYFFHNIDIFSFFIMITGISLIFMLLIGAELLEIHHRYK